MLLPPPISTLFPYTTLFRSRALIDPCRVDEAVADHPFSLFERGQDRRIDVVAARGREQDRLDLRPKRLGGAREQHMAHDVGARRTAGLARHHHADRQRAQAIGQEAGLGRFTGALPALEGNETSAHPAATWALRMSLSGGTAAGTRASARGLISVCCGEGTGRSTTRSARTTGARLVRH